MFHDGTSWVVELLSTRGDVTGLARISAKDTARVREHRWSLVSRKRAVGTGYAECSGKRLRLHRFILDAPCDKEVDHVNGDGLDCRRRNMRLTTRAKNAQNLGVRRDSSTGHRNVIWDKARAAYRVEVRVNGVSLYGGRFQSLAAAKRKAREMRTGAFTHHNEDRAAR